MAPPTSAPAADLPVYLTLTLAQEAERDADRVVVYLDSFLRHIPGVDASASRYNFPSWFLFELAAALRLYLWEHNGIRAHLDAGLPTADEAIQAVFRRLNDVGTPTATDHAPLSSQVLRLFVERFAWFGQPDLAADMLLGEAIEDELVDVLAKLIWTHRADLRRRSGDTVGGAS
jgi:hypothetical protein